MLLEVNNLSVEYIIGKMSIPVLDNVSFAVGAGEIVGIAGESGCGKSTLGLAVARLLPESGAITNGQVFFKNRDLAKLSDREMDKEIRGNEITMVFQNPESALNPVFRIETQLNDFLKFQETDGNRRTKQERRRESIRLLTETDIADVEARISNYPFEFSGGMKQRVMIAMALSSGASLLIADEPTTALDVTIAAQINQLLAKLVSTHGCSILYVSHDLGLLSEICDRIVIMYAGKIVESGTVEQVFGDPIHPYTKALIAAVPGEQSVGNRLSDIPGQVPPLNKRPVGCNFAPRCPFAFSECLERDPDFELKKKSHGAACFLEKGA